MMLCRTFFFIFVIFVLSKYKMYASAAPISVLTSSRSEDQQSFSPISYVASKAMGALVKCASLACQLLPIPDFIKPARPTFKIVKPSNLCVRDVDFSLEDFN